MVRLIGFRASPREVWQIAHMARLNAFAGFGLGFFLHVLLFADAAGAVILVARLYFNRRPPVFGCLRSQDCKCQ